MLKKGNTKIKTLFYSIGLLLLCMSCGEVPIIEPAQEVESFYENFEGKNTSQFHLLVNDSLKNLSYPSFLPNNINTALKNTLNPDDFLNNGYRTELAMYNCAKYKTVVAYSFSFMIDSNYADYDFNLICQWQDLPYYNQGEAWEPYPPLRTASPPLALVYADSVLDIKMNNDPNSNKKTFKVGDSYKVIKGVWYEFSAHVYWDDTDEAYIEIKINGNYMTPFNGTDYKFYNKNLYNRAGNYFKFGQYRGKNKPEVATVVYFDNISIQSIYPYVSKP
ncbi:MAG: heparin lyase I family protein [Bacteroidales bacterium]|nr:heparin lyase I family protein [Bacteroidales bacterium]